MLAQVAPTAVPTAMSTAQAWLPVLIQGGFATVCLVLSFVVKTMWARILDLEKQKEAILERSIKDAQEETREAQVLTAKLIEEQTKTRGVIERIERKLNGANS